MVATVRRNSSEKSAVDLDTDVPASHSQASQRGEENRSLPNANDKNDEGDTDSSDLTDYDRNAKPVEEGSRSGQAERPTEAQIISEQSREIKKLLQRKKTLNKKVRLLSKENKDFKRVLEESEEQTRTLKGEREEREARFQEVQTEALDLLKKNAIDAMPDDEVVDEFKSIFAICRRFAKKHARPLPADQRRVNETIRESLCPDGDNSSVSVKGLQAVCEGRLSTRHVLTASLAGVLAHQLFARPFFYLRSRKHQGYQMDMERLLLAVEDMGANGRRSAFAPAYC